MSAFANESGWSIGTGLPVFDPFVHAPEMRVRAASSPSAFTMPRDERQLLGRPDRPADADGIVGRRLLPGADVLQRFGADKTLRACRRCATSKPGPRQLQRSSRVSRAASASSAIERRVVPPIRRDFADRSGHNYYLELKRLTQRSSSIIQFQVTFQPANRFVETDDRDAAQMTSAYFTPICSPRSAPKRFIVSTYSSMP